jgi:hypothetical protein
VPAGAVPVGVAPGGVVPLGALPDEGLPDGPVPLGSPLVGAVPLTGVATSVALIAPLTPFFCFVDDVGIGRRRDSAPR